MVATVLSISALIFAVGITAVGVGAVLHLTRQRSTGEEDLKVRVAALELKVEELPSLWEIAVQRAEESLAQAKREHGRARAARSATEKRIREQEDDQSDPDLFEHDGAGSEIQRVPPVRSTMAVPTPNARPWPPGLSPLELAGLI